MRRVLLAWALGTALCASSGRALAQENEEADGSFVLDVSGETEAQFLFSKAAFRNVFLLVQPTTGGMCDVGGTLLAGCVFDSGTCDSCPTCNLPADCDCSCRFNETLALGNFTAGTAFEAQLQVDEGRDGTIDHVWYANPASNSDALDHLRTFNIASGQWLLQWEDKTGAASDFDFNDVVSMIRVRQAAVPAVATNVSEISGLHYLTNVMIEDIGVPDRKIRVTVVTLNSSASPIDFAVCPMLNYDRSTTSEINVSYGSIDASGAPNGCATSASGTSFRFSRDQRLDNACPHPGPVVGDRVTIPGATGGTLGQLAFEYEFPIATLDAMVAAPNELGDLSAAEIRDLFTGTGSASFYTDFAHDITIPQIRCPSGPLVAFDAVDSPFASWGFNWSLPTSISIESPVTVRIPTDNGTLMNAALPPITAVLDYFWTDNLPAHLKGHIAPTIPARTPFLTGNSGRHYTRVTLNFPDDLPEGFRGRLDTVMRDESGETIYVASTQHFAKDHTPPNVVAIHSERTETELEVSATVNDPPTGIGQVRVTPSVAGVPGRPEYLRYVAGDFFEDTQMRSRFDALRPRDRVELELVASDGNNNQVTLADLPVANTGGDRTVECRSARGRAVQLDARRSTIPEGASVTWSGPFGTLDGRRERVRLPLGTTSINLTIEDERGFTSSQTSNVTVRDTRPPRIDRDRPLCFDARRREVPPLRVFRSGTGGEHQSGYVVIRAERDLAPRVEDRCDRHPDVLISDVSLRARDHRRRSQDAGAVVFADHVCIPIERHPRAREIEVLLRDASGNERSAEFVVDPDARHCDRLRHPEVVDVNNPVCSASSLRRSSDISSKEQSPGSTERESSCALERAGGRGGASALLALVVVSMAAGARRRRRLGAVNAELSR